MENGGKWVLFTLNKPLTLALTLTPPPSPMMSGKVREGQFD